MKYSKNHHIVEMSDKVFAVVETGTLVVKEHYHGSRSDTRESVEKLLIDFSDDCDCESCDISLNDIREVVGNAVSNT